MPLHGYLLHDHGIVCQAQLVLPSFFTELGQYAKVSHVSLSNLFQVMLSTLDSEEALKAEDMCHCWNYIINKGLEVEVHRPRDIVVA